MLRIGKNAKDQEENDHSNQRPEVPDYSTPKTYPSYQTTSAELKPAEATTTGGSTRGAMTESESLAREIKEGNLSGFVGSGTVVTGEANFKAMMRVDGHLSGRINSSSGTLIVGANGKVDANIEVAIAIVHGTVNGDIIATQRLELGRAAQLNGNIQTASLMIEPGAVFEGSCKMIKLNQSKSKVNGRDKTLDTTSMKPINADATPEAPEIENVSSIASYNSRLR